MSTPIQENIERISKASRLVRPELRSHDGVIWEFLRTSGLLVMQADFICYIAASYKLLKHAPVR